MSDEDSNHSFYIFEQGGIGTNTTSSDDHYSFGVRPMVTLRANLDVVSGDGSFENPYMFEIKNASMALNEQSLGTYFELDGYVFRIVGFENGKTKAMMQDVLRKEDGNVYVRRFSYSQALFDVEDSSSVAYYLNHTWLNQLIHKDYLTKGTFAMGSFTHGGQYSFENVNKKTIHVKVGLPEIYGLYNVNTFDQEDEVVYWTMQYKSSKNNITWTLRQADWLFGDFCTMKYALRPVIYLKDTISIVPSDVRDGSYDMPYEIEMMEVTK